MKTSQLENRFTSPNTTADVEREREWIHPVAPRYYLYQNRESKMWMVVDRTRDLRVTKEYRRKHDCVKGFYVRMKDQRHLPLYEMT